MSTISFGTGQTNGAPLLITAITLGAAQTLHTAAAALADPHLISLYAFNSSDQPVLASISLYDAAAVLIATYTKYIAAKAYMQPVLDEGNIDADFILNGTIEIKVHAETASVLSFCARVDDQVP